MLGDRRRLDVGSIALLAQARLRCLLVALPAVQDLLFSAKHFVVAAKVAILTLPWAAKE